MPNIVNTLLDLPENDDSMDCPECEDGQDEFGDCWYCGGDGVISEREYKEKISVELEDFNANN